MMNTTLFANDMHKCNYHILEAHKYQKKTTRWQLNQGLRLLNRHKNTIHQLYTERTHTQSDLQSACVILASLTFWSVVRLLMRTVIICRGMCWTRLARAMEGSNEGSEMRTNTLWNDYQGTKGSFKTCIYCLTDFS